MARIISTRSRYHRTRRFKTGRRMILIDQPAVGAPCTVTARSTLTLERPLRAGHEGRGLLAEVGEDGRGVGGGGEGDEAVARGGRSSLDHLDARLDRMLSVLVAVPAEGGDAAPLGSRVKEGQTKEEGRERRRRRECQNGVSKDEEDAAASGCCHCCALREVHCK